VNQHGKINGVSRSKIKKKNINHQILNCISTALNTNPTASSRYITNHLQKECGIKVSRSTTSRLIKRCGYSFKKAFRVSDKIHDPEQILKFCDTYQNSSSIICIDEAGFYIGEQSKRGYALKGKRLNLKSSRILRRKKYTLLMAITKERILHYEILDHNCKKVDFIAFVNRIPKLPDATTLMDNVAFHKSTDTLDALIRNGFTPLFIPPYSPRVNAIENVFGWLKSRYRRNCPLDSDALFDYKSLFEDCIRNICDLKPFFNRVDLFIRKTIETNGESFVGYDE
jgi:transposase